jgi:uncharacterized protein (DUF2236 family)
MQGAGARVQNEFMERPPRGGITWRIAGERVGLLAWPRAILLQLAHPLVAAGVAAHSGFRASPLAPYARLHATVGTMRHLVFGSSTEAADAVCKIRGIHDRVHGALGAATGTYGSGASYSAHDSALLVWVHATLLDSHVRVMEPVLGAFTAEELDGYCRETAPLTMALGAKPADVPLTWQEVQCYMAAEIDSGRIAVGKEARGLAPAVLRPSIARLAWPLQYAGELVAVGLLPSPIRDGYGFPWSAARERRLQRLLAALRVTRRFTPDAVARWPEARRASG